MRKDALISLVDALKSRELTPTQLVFDADGNLLQLHVMAAAPAPALEAEDRERPAPAARRVSALRSIGQIPPASLNRVEG
jgi:hypothetical protein